MSCRQRFFVGFAAMVPVNCLLILVDVFLWHWLPWAFYVIVPLVAPVLVPWMVLGEWPWQLARDRSR